MIKRAFTEHPASVGESYFQHMGMALRFSARLILGGLACLAHAVFPFLFVTTGRRCIEDLHQRMVAHRDCREGDHAHRRMAPLARDTARLNAAE